MLTNLKTKLLAFMTAIIGVLVIVAMYFKGRLTAEKLDRAEEAADLQDTTQELSSRASAANLKGVQDENVAIIRNGKRID